MINKHFAKKDIQDALVNRNGFNILKEVKKAYAQGENIIKYINQHQSINSALNSKEAILISYDFQAGSYVKAYKESPQKYANYLGEISNILNSLGEFESILEAGIGEATTFNTIVNSCNIPNSNQYGFDISWSRVKVAKEFMKEQSPQLTPHLFVADLFSIPLQDNSIDLVYTSHSIEPNGGFEEPILTELYRVAKKYLVLFEPDYGFADEEGRRRMEEHGYIKELFSTAKSLGYNVIDRFKLQNYNNPLNPTSVIIIKKPDNQTELPSNPFICPITKCDLIDCGEVYFAQESYLMYPVIKKIPCLLESNAILGCKYTP